MLGSELIHIIIQGLYVYGHLDTGGWRSFVDPYPAPRFTLRHVTSATASLKSLAKNGNTIGARL